METYVLETIVNEALTVLLKRGKRVLSMIKKSASCDNGFSHQSFWNPYVVVWPVPDLQLPYVEHKIHPCIKEGGQILSVFPLLFFQALKLSLKISWHDQRYQVIFQLTRPECSQCMEETSQRMGTCAIRSDMGKDRRLWPEPHYHSHNCVFHCCRPFFLLLSLLYTYS